MALWVGPYESILDKMQDPPEAGTHFFGRVTHIVDPNNFYVLPLKNEKLLPYLQQPGIRVSRPKVGIIVIYNGQNGEYIRGLIRDITDNKCKIFAMDYGYTDENVDITELFRPINEEANLAAPFALNCELYKCQPQDKQFCDKSIQMFKKFVGGPDALLKIYVKGKNPIKLKVVLHNNNDDVGTLLAISQLTISANEHPETGEPQPLPSITFPWKFRTLEIGETLIVTIQYGIHFSEVYVCTEQDYRDYWDNRASFTSYCQTQNEITDLDFNVGTPVGVLVESEPSYERGLIQRILKPSLDAQVRLIDWGEVITVPKSKLRSINTSMFSMIPVRAIYCCIVNKDHTEDQLPLIQGCVYEMTVLEVGFQFTRPYIITLNLAMPTTAV